MQYSDPDQTEMSSLIHTPGQPVVWHTSSYISKLKPVEFYNADIVNLNDAIPETELQLSLFMHLQLHMDEAVEELNSPTLRRNTTTDCSENIPPKMSTLAKVLKQQEAHTTSFA